MPTLLPPRYAPRMSATVGAMIGFTIFGIVGAILTIAILGFEPSVAMAF